MKELVKNKKAAYIISIFCMFLWGSAFPTVKILYKELGISSSSYFEMIFVAGLRFFIAGIFVILLMYKFDRKNMYQIKENFWFLSRLSLIVTTFAYLFSYIGMGNTSGMKSSIITASSTFLVVIFSHFFLKNEKFNVYKLLAIILGLAGTVVSNLNKDFNLNFSILGEGFMFLNSVMMAYGIIFIKKNSKYISSFALASGQFLIGSIPLIIIGYLGLANGLNFTFKSIILLVYGGIISSVAFTLWYFVLNQYKASEISFIRLFIPFFGTFLSSIILGESLNVGILIGLILVILGIIIINKNNR